MVAKLIWRHYEQAALDRQYNSRGTVPDVNVFLHAYGAGTEAAKASLACHQDVRYGTGADECLDIYPSAQPNAPVLVFLHGGDWRSLSKDDGGFAAPAFVAGGFAFVALNFSLVPRVGVLEMGSQVRRALAWLWCNIASFGGDAGKLHIAGHSSGANLVGQLLMTDWATAFGLPSDLIKSALFASGLGDLEPVRLSFRNASLQLTPEVVSRVSLLRKKPLARCPLLVLVGESETDDYRLQSREVADFWKALGNEVQLHELRGRHHFDAVLEWADPASAVFEAHVALMLAARSQVSPTQDP